VNWDDFLCAAAMIAASAMAVNALGLGHVPRDRAEAGREPGDLGKFMTIPSHADDEFIRDLSALFQPAGDSQGLLPVTVNLAAEVRWIPDAAAAGAHAAPQSTRTGARALRGRRRRHP
jgi:hypothetical protein